ncbi:hypothetical protein CEXT_287271 [Caerostris extrusa]|uniref:Uncharacterized protein n=1 Tax=Caerostris extrusa TaxID=172846 RepID=A0AAV4XK77_CAEEX|nr:hypothetical protein CEXT_287271 [Caerostris extrusa]
MLLCVGDGVTVCPAFGPAIVFNGASFLTLWITQQRRNHREGNGRVNGVSRGTPMELFNVSNSLTTKKEL